VRSLIDPPYLTVVTRDTPVLQRRARKLLPNVYDYYAEGRNASGPSALATNRGARPGWR